MHRMSHPLSLAALALILAATGCGGPASPEPGVAHVASEDSAPLEPQHGSTPTGTAEVYDEITSALDWAYADLGRPMPGFDNLSRVQASASEQLAGEAFDWPTGTSYSLSVLDDRIAVYINCDGLEKKGDWVPTPKADTPS